MTGPAGYHCLKNDWTQRIAAIGAPAYAVLGVLSMHADQAGTCWPSVSRIADMTGLSPRSVRSQLRRLEEAGMIVTEGRRDGRLRLSNLYRIVDPPISPRNETTVPPERNDSTHGTKRPLPPERNGTTPRNEAPVEQYPIEPTPLNKTKARATAQFTPPTLEEVSAYCRERGNHVDAQRFLDYYESNGWRVGRNAMKDWHAAIRTWEKNGFSNGHTSASPFSQSLRCPDENPDIFGVNSR